jgi:glycosyltransferase involved in cell wall biosynthesis
LGHEVVVIGCGSADWAQGLRVIGRFHATPIPLEIMPILSAVRKSQVVHIVGFRDPVGTIAALAAQSAHVPYVLEPVGMYGRKLRSFYLKRAFDWTLGTAVRRGAARIVVTSRIEELELRAVWFDSGSVVLRPNGVATDNLLPLPERGSVRRELGIPMEAPLVVALGRIARIKGLDLFLRALAQIPGAWGTIAGPDEKDGTLNKLIELRHDLGIESRCLIIPTGFWGDRKAQLLSDADVLCQPSRSESFGNSAAEAAAVGLPVVATDSCGVADWLGGAAFRTVPYGNLDALRLAIEDLLRPEMHIAAQQAGDSVRKLLDWDEVARRQSEVYQELVADGASAKTRL